MVLSNHTPHTVCEARETGISDNRLSNLHSYFVVQLEVVGWIYSLPVGVKEKFLSIKSSYSRVKVP